MAGVGPPLLMEVLMNINAQSLVGDLTCKMRGISFRCPRHQSHTHAWISDEILESSSDNSYVTIPCTACQQSHLINPHTGAVMGAGNDRNPQGT